MWTRRSLGHHLLHPLIQIPNAFPEIWKIVKLWQMFLDSSKFANLKRNCPQDPPYFQDYCSIHMYIDDQKYVGKTAIHVKICSFITFSPMLSKHNACDLALFDIFGLPQHLFMNNLHQKFQKSPERSWMFHCFCSSFQNRKLIFMSSFLNIVPTIFVFS